MGSINGINGPTIGPGGGTGYRNGPIQLLTAIAVTLVTYTPTASDYTIEVNAAAAPFAVPLPPAAACGGREYIIKKVDASANAVTLSDVSGGNVEGAASVAITGQNAFVKVQSDGTQWVITGGNASLSPNGAAGALAAITVGASPFSYTAPAAGSVVVGGGTVSAITLKRGTPAAITMGITAGNVPVSPGDIVTTTYSVLPTMNFVPR